MSFLVKKLEIEVREELTLVGALRYLTAREDALTLLSVILPKVEPVEGAWTETGWSAHAFAYKSGELTAEYRHTYETRDEAQADIEEWFIDFARLERRP